MKNTEKILAALLCAGILLFLAACGGKNDPADTGAGTATAGASAEKQTGDTGKPTGGDIILPEDGKITFGEKDSQPADTTEEASGTTGTQTGPDTGDKETAGSQGKETEADASAPDDSTGDTSAPADSTGDTSASAEDTPADTSAPAGPSGDKSWGGIVWN